MTRTAAPALARWQGLDARQRASLVVAYAVDQEEMAAQRSRRAQSGRGAPLEEARWLPCAPDWPLHTHLERRGLLDGGTGATFAALAGWQLVDCRHDETALGITLLVRLTPLGRWIARAGWQASSSMSPTGGVTTEEQGRR